MTKITVFRARRLVITRLAESLSRFEFLRPWLMRRFVANLQRLNDALKRTELDGHYWVWSGLLLGWARDGAVLAHDCLDADFAVADRDFHRLVDAVPAIMRAGFRCDRRFVIAERRLRDRLVGRGRRIGAPVGSGDARVERIQSPGG